MRRLTLALGMALVAAITDPLIAGMPAALPEDIETILRLEESAHERLTAISFFLLGIALSAALVRFLWNCLARDFRLLPRLTYPKALALVTLWGLLFIVVLTMISGARELMTPGAWKKQGFTYTLENPTSAPSPVDPSSPGTAAFSKEEP